VGYRFNIERVTAETNGHSHHPSFAMSKLS
jgi:hypothetical protein